MLVQKTLSVGVGSLCIYVVKMLTCKNLSDFFDSEEVKCYFTSLKQKCCWLLPEIMTHMAHFSSLFSRCSFEFFCKIKMHLPHLGIRLHHCVFEAFNAVFSWDESQWHCSLVKIMCRMMFSCSLLLYNMINNLFKIIRHNVKCAASKMLHFQH